MNTLGYPTGSISCERTKSYIKSLFIIDLRYIKCYLGTSSKNLQLFFIMIAAARLA